MKKQQFIDDVLINLKNEVSGFSVLFKNGGLLLATPATLVHVEMTRGVVTFKQVTNGGPLHVHTVDYNTGFKDNAVALTTEALVNLLGLKNESEVF